MKHDPITSTGAWNRREKVCDRQCSQLAVVANGKCYGGAGCQSASLEGQVGQVSVRLYGGSGRLKSTTSLLVWMLADVSCSARGCRWLLAVVSCPSCRCLWLQMSPAMCKSLVQMLSCLQMFLAVACGGKCVGCKCSLLGASGCRCFSCWWMQMSDVMVACSCLSCW